MTDLVNRLVLTIPKPEGDILFRPDVVRFLLIIVLLLSGILVSFWGHKYLMTLAAIIAGCLSGFCGISVLKGRINDPVIMMFLFVMFVFLTECLFYAVYSLILMAFHSFGGTYAASKKLGDILSYTSPFLGGGIVFAVLYICVLRDFFVCLVIAIFVAASGFIYQKKNRSFKKRFYTYDMIARQTVKESDH
ncbi:MAG: hypothetical protein IJ803_08880 [Oribacterium sp.]|nr:hypothetical protein [Oribacterium sp.]